MTTPAADKARSAVAYTSPAAGQAYALIDLAEAIRFHAILTAMTPEVPILTMEDYERIITDAKRLAVSTGESE